jgi:sugar phosphate isomerase/epimerase
MAPLLLPARARAVAPFGRPSPARLRLSLAAYSFRDYFKDATHKRAANPAGAGAKEIDMFDFVDYCAAQGCDGAELTSYYFPKAIDKAYLVKLRRHCFLRGIDVSGTAVGNTFTLPAGQERDAQIRSVKQWVDYAAILGAPHIRVFAGEEPKGSAPGQARKQCIVALEECGDYAGQQGIFLGIENHGGIVAEPGDLLDIVRAVQSPWVGINLDGGNFHGEDPYKDFAACAPYAINVQLKADVQRRGQKVEPADLKRQVQLLREVNYQGYVALEYESPEDPWKAVPRLLRQLQEIFAAS